MARKIKHGSINIRQSGMNPKKIIMKPIRARLITRSTRETTAAEDGIIKRGK
jgi:hypothetical protein